MLSENLFNEFYLFLGNKKLNIKNKININLIINKLNAMFKKKVNIKTYLDKDKLIHYY